MKMTVARIALLALVLIASAPLLAEDEEPKIKEIKMTVENWKWTPSTIRVEVGTTLRMEIHSYDATHRFDLKAFGLKENLREDSDTIVEFVADRVGEFKWKCGRPCGNGCPKMIGELIVTEVGDEGR